MENTEFKFQTFYDNIERQNYQNSWNVNQGLLKLTSLSLDTSFSRAFLASSYSPLSCAIWRPHCKLENTHTHFYIISMSFWVISACYGTDFIQKQNKARLTLSRWLIQIKMREKRRSLYYIATLNANNVTGIANTIFMELNLFHTVQRFSLLY